MQRVGSCEHRAANNFSSSKDNGLTESSFWLKKEKQQQNKVARFHMCLKQLFIHHQ